MPNRTVSPEPAERYSRRAVEFYTRYHVGDPDAVTEILAPGWVNHPRRQGEPAGPEGFKGIVAGLLAAFPDLRFRVEDVLVDGDRVAVRAVGTGTHTGDAFGPPTGRTIAFRTQDIHRFDPDGMIVETWHAEDVFGMVASMGLVANMYGARLEPYPGWD